MDLLSAGDSGSRSWHSMLWPQWVTTLSGPKPPTSRMTPGAARHLAKAKAHADRYQIAGALTPGCRSAPAGTHPHPRQEQEQRATGEGELTRMGAPALCDDFLTVE
jgi:hypothetical protein